MKFAIWRHIAAAGTACWLAAVGQAFAQEKAVISAQTYAGSKATAVVAVRPLDNSYANLDLKRTIEQLLLQAGYGVQDDARTVLSFEGREEMGAFSDSGQRYILELESRGDTLTGDAQQARLNLFNSQSGGLLNPGRGSGNVSRVRYELEFTLADRGSGARLWQAWGHADVGQGDAADVAPRLAKSLVGTFGRTVRGETAELN
ncbi:MAG: hypothetical protein O3A88_07255 [Proteobacteria bacterium]|nr:hypothetical protein [Pseudomonadota bacterium]